MYTSSPFKQLTISNFLALPFTNQSLFGHPLYFLSAVFSIIFCIIALSEIIHIIWNHFHLDPNWE